MNPQAAKKMGIQPFRPSDYLLSPTDRQDYLLACIQEAPKDAALMLAAKAQINHAESCNIKDRSSKKF